MYFHFNFFRESSSDLIHILGIISSISSSFGSRISSSSHCHNSISVTFSVSLYAPAAGGAASGTGDHPEIVV